MLQEQSLPPNYYYHRLANGIEMLGQYMPSLSSTTFGLQVDAGVINEPPDKLGLAHLFEYMLFQGTKKKNARVLNDAFESLGAHKGASSGLETSQVWAQIVHTKFDATLDLIQEVLLTPTFPEDDVEQMKNVILQEIRRRDDEPMSRVFELLRAKFYAGTALARSSLGTTESVGGLQRQDVVNFWQDRFLPNDAIFSIAGKFDWEHVVARMEELFDGWQGIAMASPQELPMPTSSVALEHQEGKQEHLALMFPFPGYTDPDYYPAMVIGEVLGGNMASRLFVEVREKRGLVYSVSAGNVSNKHIGAMRVYAGTTPEQGHECLQVIVDQLRALEKSGITEDELSRAKVQLKSESIMRSEGSGSRMGAITRSWWYERKLRTVQQVKEAIDAVTLDQVMAVLHRFSPLAPLTVAAIGPLDEATLVGDTLS